MSHEADIPCKAIRFRQVQLNANTDVPVPYVAVYFFVYP
jgi:hypothetical protein